MNFKIFSKALVLFFCCTLYAFQCHVGSGDRLTASKNNLYSQDSDMPNEPGKCFAKSLIPDKYETITLDSMAMYTGSDSSNIMFAKRTLREASKGTKWVKKKADRDCLAKNPEDCLVWCLVEENIAEVFVEYLADTSQTEDWEYQSVSREILVEDRGYSEWKEVICADDITDRFYMDLKNALEIRGYDVEISSLGFEEVDKASLRKFQEDNGLPIGQLDVESLAALEVNY